MRIELSGCSIINDKNEILLLWKNKHNHFEFPGGKVEADETYEEAAKRECKEELGVDVILIKYLGYEDFEIDNNSWRSHMFLAKIKNDKIPKVNEPDKFKEIFWLPIKEYEKYTCAPNVKTFCQKYNNKNN